MKRFFIDLGTYLGWALIPMLLIAGADGIFRLVGTEGLLSALSLLLGALSCAVAMITTERTSRMLMEYLAPKVFEYHEMTRTKREFAVFRRVHLATKIVALAGRNLWERHTFAGEGRTIRH